MSALVPFSSVVADSIPPKWFSLPCTATSILSSTSISLLFHAHGGSIVSSLYSACEGYREFQVCASVSVFPGETMHGFVVVKSEEEESWEGDTLGVWLIAFGRKSIAMCHCKSSRSKTELCVWDRCTMEDWILDVVVVKDAILSHNNDSIILSCRLAHNLSRCVHVCGLDDMSSPHLCIPPHDERSFVRCLPPCVLFSSATFSPSDESGDVSVAVGTALFEVRIYRGQYGSNREPVHRWKAHEGSIFSLTWSDDGCSLVSCSDDSFLRCWVRASTSILDGFSLKSTMFGHRKRVHCACFVPETNGHRLVSAGEDGTVRVWNTQSGDSISIWTVPESPPIWTLSLDWKSKLLCTGSGDGAVFVWSLDRIFQSSDPSTISSDLLQDSLPTRIVSISERQHTAKSRPNLVRHIEPCPLTCGFLACNSSPGSVWFCEESFGEGRLFELPLPQDVPSSAHSICSSISDDERVLVLAHSWGIVSFAVLTHALSRESDIFVSGFAEFGNVTFKTLACISLLGSGFVLAMGTGTGDIHVSEFRLDSDQNVIHLQSNITVSLSHKAIPSTLKFIRMNSYVLLFVGDTRGSLHVWGFDIDCTEDVVSLQFSLRLWNPCATILTYLHGREHITSIQLANHASFSSSTGIEESFYLTTCGRDGQICSVRVVLTDWERRTLILNCAERSRPLSDVDTWRFLVPVLNENRKQVDLFAVGHKDLLYTVWSLLKQKIVCRFPNGSRKEDIGAFARATASASNRTRVDVVIACSEFCLHRTTKSVRIERGTNVLFQAPLRASSSLGSRSYRENNDSSSTSLTLATSLFESLPAQQASVEIVSGMHHRDIWDVSIISIEGGLFPSSRFIFSCSEDSTWHISPTLNGQPILASSIYASSPFGARRAFCTVLDPASCRLFLFTAGAHEMVQVWCLLFSPDRSAFSHRLLLGSFHTSEYEMMIRWKSLPVPDVYSSAFTRIPTYSSKITDVDSSALLASKSELLDVVSVGTKISERTALRNPVSLLYQSSSSPNSDQQFDSSSSVDEANDCTFPDGDDVTANDVTFRQMDICVLGSDFSSLRFVTSIVSSDGSLRVLGFDFNSATHETAYVSLLSFFQLESGIFLSLGFDAVSGCLCAGSSDGEVCLFQLPLMVDDFMERGIEDFQSPTDLECVWRAKLHGNGINSLSLSQSSFERCEGLDSSDTSVAPPKSGLLLVSGGDDHSVRAVFLSLTEMNSSFATSASGFNSSLQGISSSVHSSGVRCVCTLTLPLVRKNVLSTTTLVFSSGMDQRICAWESVIDKDDMQTLCEDKESTELQHRCVSNVQLRLRGSWFCECATVQSMDTLFDEQEGIIHIVVGGSGIEVIQLRVGTDSTTAELILSVV